MASYLDKIASILRTDKKMLHNLSERMGVVAGHDDVIERIGNQNDEVIRDRLLTLGIALGASAKGVYDSLISKIESDDNKIFEAFNRPVCHSPTDCQSILVEAKKISGTPKGFFLKLDKAREFLEKEPPKFILEYLGYTTVSEMLAKEDIFEVYSALRFLESPEWLNTVFFKHYQSVTPHDFEVRDVELRALGEKWIEAAKKFVAKKYHNISHLKELGVVFVIPISLGISGELIRMLSLIFHYLHEVPFYSDIFRMLAEKSNQFSADLISLLRGDVFENRLIPSDKAQWLVIQRYLAKDDKNDWRLFVPHINPEALHWLRAEEDIVKLESVIGSKGNKDGLSFWHNLDWVGDYFKDESGIDILVSFNLVDTAMSLVQEKDMIKYLYHHQEALWNKIFIEYLGLAELEKKAKENIFKGWFEI